jgi:hypothetical protein
MRRSGRGLCRPIAPLDGSRATTTWGGSDYDLGRALGAALAGGDAALGAIASLVPLERREYAVGFLAVLGGKTDPRELARALAELPA